MVATLHGRRKEMKLALARLFAVGLVASTVSLRAQNYNVTDLGVVSGDSKSTGAGLNDSGQAAGTSSNPSAAIATLFSNGKAINIGNLGGDVALATAINSVGQVAGRSTIPGETEFHAFLYSNGVIRDIHSTSHFPPGS